MNSSRFVIVLVHGTWSPDAAWIQDGSFFRKELASHLGGDVTFEPLVWSGRNRFQARVQAAEILRKRLDDSLAARPDARHIVIGHSHGGSIALYALAEDSLAKRVKVVCLSTPFIHARARPVSTYQREILPPLIGTVLGLAVLGLFAAATKLFNSIAQSYEVTERFALSPIVPMGIGMLLLLFAGERWNQRAKITFEQLKYPSLDRSRLLIIRMSGDEAASGLAAARTAAWLANRVARALDWVSSIPANILGRVSSFAATLFRAPGRNPNALNAIKPYIVFLLYALLLAMGLAIGAPDEGAFHKYLAPPAYVAFLLILAPLYVGALLAIPAVATMFLGAAGFGADLAGFAMSLDLSVEPTPPGEWNVIQYSWPADASSHGMLHSACYNYPTAIAQIAQFISADRPTSGNRL